jgi:hypothetical protein
VRARSLAVSLLAHARAHTHTQHVHVGYRHCLWRGFLRDGSLRGWGQVLSLTVEHEENSLILEREGVKGGS